MPTLATLLRHHPHAPLLQTVGAVAQQLGLEVWAVGGMVRDLLLGRQTTDLDFVTVGAGTGIRLAEAVAQALGGVTAHVYPNFGTAAIRLPGPPPTDLMNATGEQVLEFVAARRESYRRDSRKPLVEEGTLEEDLARRDFTINAMAVALNETTFGTLLDPFGGQADLACKRLVTPLDPGQTFEDDPLRMIRAARFAAQLGFEIEAATLAAMKAGASRVRILSQERITDEFNKLLCAPAPSVGLKILFETGLLHEFFPELVALQGVSTIGGYQHKDNFFHTLQVVDNLAAMVADQPPEQTLWLRWATLLHDIAKPLTRRFMPGEGWSFHGHEERGARMVPKLFRRFRLPEDERMRYVQQLVRLHHRPTVLVDEHVTDSAVRRLLFEAGDAIDDLMRLVRADITSRNPRRVRRYLEGFDLVEQKMAEVEEKDRLRNFQPPVDGLEIMATLSLAPGPLVGRLKEAIREAILDGHIPNEHDAAFAYLMQIKDAVLAESYPK